MNDATALLTRLDDLAAAMCGRAEALDETGGFPVVDIAALTAAGVLSAPFTHRIGISADTADSTLRLFAALGRGNLAVGRVIEAHFNALRLILRYGDDDTIAVCNRDVAAGHLFALWVTDPANDPLRLDGTTLTGCKQFCSAAGYATRAVVTAANPDETVRLAYVKLERGVHTEKLSGGLQGMRAANTGQVRFNAVSTIPFGAPGDYLREPDFSAGAWRTSAVTLGGLQALVAEAVRQVVARGRAHDPHQQARMGQAMIARETSRLWMQQAARRAEAADEDPTDAVAYVNFARLAVERACLETITLVQRSLGAAAFLRPNPVERICRDLGTYLRQPAGDMVLVEAAAHGMGL